VALDDADPGEGPGLQWLAPELDDDTVTHAESRLVVTDRGHGAGAVQAGPGKGSVKLTAILLVCACAAVCSAKSIDELAEFGERATNFCWFPRDTPPAARPAAQPQPVTLGRVLQALDGDALDQALCAYPPDPHRINAPGARSRQVIAVDGKVLKGSADLGTQRRHLLSAVTHDRVATPEDGRRCMGSDLAGLHGDHQQQAFGQDLRPGPPPRAAALGDRGDRVQTVGMQYGLRQHVDEATMPQRPLHLALDPAQVAWMAPRLTPCPRGP
jgi:hypothetical protein